MADWIIGGLIIVAAAYIIIKNISRIKKGENPCAGCTGCSGGQCPSSKIE